MNRDLFSDIPEFNSIKESEIVFPLYFKNRYNTCFTMYYDEEKFMQVSINKSHESFRGNILFGFNETLHDLKGDLKIFYYVTSRNQTQIDAQEFNNVFEKIIAGQQEFFSQDSNQKYIERQQLSNGNLIKHKWRPIIHL